MYRRNATVKCPSCGTGNKPDRWFCWKCKNERGVVTELEEVGGASPPWAENKVVYGGAVGGRVGASTYWRNPSTNNFYIGLLEQTQDYASRIYEAIPTGSGLADWMEDSLAVTADYMSKIVHALRYRENPQKKYMAKANARLIKSYSEELIQLIHASDSLKDWMKSKISTCATRVDDIWHAMEARGDGALTKRRKNVNANTLIPPEVGLAVAENIFKPNPNTVELEQEEVTMQDPAELELEQLVDEIAERRNPSSGRIWGANGKWQRRNPRPAWGGPLFRRNPECKDCEDCSCNQRRFNPCCEACEDCSCKTRRNPARTARWSPCAGCSKATCTCGCAGDPDMCVCVGSGASPRRNSSPAWGGPLFRRNPRRRMRRRRNSSPAWGGPLFRNRRRSRLRRNSSPAWGGPLFRRNPRRSMRRRNSAPAWGGPLFRNRRRRFRRNSAPAWGGPLFRRNPRSRMRRNSSPAWGGPLFRSRRRRNSSPAWGGPLFRRNPEELEELEEISMRRNPFYRRNA